MKEIYWNTSNDMLLLEELKPGGSVARFDQLPRAFFKTTDLKIKETYPDQHDELCELCGYGPPFEYARVYQFCACNFSAKDGNPDIDEDGNFILERVSCPLRHTCKRNTCRAQASGRLSSREIQVVSLFVKGFSEEEIAARLFISKFTVHNHTTNIYSKLGFSGVANPDRLLVAHAVKHKLVN